jgi:hypothetical protein
MSDEPTSQQQPMDEQPNQLGRGGGMPAAIAALPRDASGKPIPWFAAWTDGLVDYRLTAPGKVERAAAGRRCWICGRRRLSQAAFLIGPTGAVARVSPWPPSHPDCALYAVRHCPFLRSGTAPGPGAVTGLGRKSLAAGPPELDAAARLELAFGMIVLWVAPEYGRLVRGGDNVFGFGEPSRVLWFYQGRPATPLEARQAVTEATAELLRAVKPHDSATARLVGLQFKRVLRWLPREGREETPGMDWVGERDADNCPDRSLQQ